MGVELKGSCHCGAVKFSLISSTPVPYQVRRSQLASESSFEVVDNAIALCMFYLPQSGRCWGVDQSWWAWRDVEDS